MNVKTTNKSLEVILRTLSGVGALGCVAGGALICGSTYNLWTDRDPNIGIPILTYFLGSSVFFSFGLAYKLGQYTLTGRNTF